MPARSQPTPQPAAPPAAAASHTAGIYADMTVDGMEIGTLVVVVDRARHLPNLRTMGKQDPYCAARLGKEAKKTDTDRRGGQTPRWDQELRFTVRDGADYNRLKVSVFNDDKRTDLIGETWVMLDSLLLPGGGQGDSWHNLSCKGKYAGEIRIELTYYDSRPKETRPHRQSRQRQSSEQATPLPQTAGPRDLPQVKRRPLPAPGKQDPPQPTPQLPITNNSPAPLQAAPHSYHTPSRRLSEQPVLEEPELQESYVELEPDMYSQHPSALASYASTSTDPYHSSPSNAFNSYELPAMHNQDQEHFSEDSYTYSDEHTGQYMHDIHQNPVFSPLRNERVQALSSGSPPRPLPPVGLSHSYSAPDAVHYDEPAGGYSLDGHQYTPEPEQYDESYSSASYDPAYVDSQARQPALPTPHHRLSEPVPHHFARAATQVYSTQALRASPMPVHTAPDTMQHTFDQDPFRQPPERHTYVASPSQPMHYQSYAQVEGEGFMVHRPQPRYPQPQPAHQYTPYSPAGRSHQHTYSVPDFSRSIGAQSASTAALRAANAWPQGRPLSMVEASTAASRTPHDYQQSQSPTTGPSTPHHLARKSVSPQAPAPTSASTHFSPDSFNTYNTHSSRPSTVAAPDSSPSTLREPSPMYAASMPTPESSPDPPSTGTRTTPDGRILTTSGKTIDPSDHIPYTSWAPEPEPKTSGRPTVAVHIKNRFGPRDARVLPSSSSSTSPGAASPASIGASPLAGASMRPRHSVNPSPVTPLPLPQSNSLLGRTRLQKRTTSNPLAESAPGTINASYRAPSSAGAPPIPPKLPLGYANGEFTPAIEPINDALSQEMSLIDIGPKEDAGRRRGLFGRRKKFDEYS